MARENTEEVQVISGREVIRQPIPKKGEYFLEIDRGYDDTLTKIYIGRVEQVHNISELQNMEFKVKPYLSMVILKSGAPRDEYSDEKEVKVDLRNVVSTGSKEKIILAVKNYADTHSNVDLEFFLRAPGEFI